MLQSGQDLTFYVKATRKLPCSEMGKQNLYGDEFSERIIPPREVDYAGAATSQLAENGIRPQQVTRRQCEAVRGKAWFAGKDRGHPIHTIVHGD